MVSQSNKYIYYSHHGNRVPFFLCGDGYGQGIDCDWSMLCSRLFVFHLNIFSVGLMPLFLICLNLILFGFSFGVVMLGLIFRFGTKIQAFAWGLLNVAQPLMAVFYPVSVLPEPLRTISYLFAPTYAFEAMRKSMRGESIFVDILYSLMFNFLFLLGAILFFQAMFKKSKETGQFARLEG